VLERFLNDTVAKGASSDRPQGDCAYDTFFPFRPIFEIARAAKSDAKDRDFDDEDSSILVAAGRSAQPPSDAFVRSKSRVPSTDL